MTRIEIEEGAADGRSDEYADTCHAEAHSKASAGLAKVVREGKDSAWGERNERAGKKPV